MRKWTVNSEQMETSDHAPKVGHPSHLERQLLCVSRAHKDLPLKVFALM